MTKAPSHTQVFDGSNMRSKSADIIHGERTAAISFVADLEKLEKEFEMHLKQLDDNGGLIPTSPSEARSQLSSRKSQRRYRAGTPGGSSKISSGEGIEGEKDSQETNLIDTITDAASQMQKSVEKISTVVDSIKNTSDLQPIDLLNLLSSKDMKRVSQNIIKETFQVVKAVKEKITDGKWVRNKEFLAQTLRKLENSVNLIDYGKTAKPMTPEITLSVFDFGLIRSGTQSGLISLSDLSNDGNMSFSFVVTADPSDVLFPVDNTNPSNVPISSPFTIQPSYGEVSPESTKTLKSCFEAYNCGLYRQKFNVTSGDDLICQFVLKGRIGIPILEVDSEYLDFGLVNRHTESKLSVTLSNVGTFEDSWKLDISSDASLDDNYSPVKVFSANLLEGSLEPGEKKIINVVFHPPSEGSFQSFLKISWLKNPIVIPLRGLGGGSKFEFRFTSPQDQMYNGLDWGTCIIGNIYEKMLQIDNVGNIEGFADVVYPKFFKFEFEKNENGLLPIMNGESKMVKVIFEPLQIENFKDIMQVTQVNGSPVPLPFKFKAGTCSWKLEGDLTFLNMKYFTREERKLTVTNDGTLDIPISFKFVTGNTSVKYYELSFKPNWVSGKMLKPGQSLEICLAMVPEEISVYEGCLQLSTQLAKGPLMNEYPFKFQTFKNEIALDDDSDIAVGRIMMGTSIEVTRTIRNYGNYDVDWRLSLQVSPLPNGKVYDAWSLVGDPSMFF
jgi:hypothetical protein